jgi:hypothetical protein
LTQINEKVAVFCSYLFSDIHLCNFTKTISKFEDSRLGKYSPIITSTSVTNC